MTKALLEHAARVLDHQPTRSMDARTLYARATREAGALQPFSRFMEMLHSQPHRFAVIVPDPVIGAPSSWDPRQRALYEAALAAAGLAAPLVVLAEPPAEPDDRDTFPAREALLPADVLSDAHRSLMHLLRSTDVADPLRGALVAALEELHVLQRAL